MIWYRLRQTIFGLLITGVAICSISALMLQIRGGRLLSVQTGSMVPIIRKGDLVIVKRVPSSQLAVGDIITFINPANHHTTLTHRVVQAPTAANRQTIITKGDVNKVDDPPIKTNQVIGRVVTHLPYLGTVSDLLHTWPGLIALVYLPALLIIGAEFKKLSAYYRSQTPYILAGYVPTHNDANNTVSLQRVAMKLSFILALALSLVIVAPVLAALQSQATLTGTSISTGPLVHAPSGSNSSCDITNNNNISFTNNNPQTATTGDVNQGQNTSGGAATSGDASNSSSSSATITINNSNVCHITTTSSTSSP